MLEALKKQVCDANLKLVQEGLVTWTFGNVSGIDRETGSVVIKPSGLDYNVMQPQHMVVVSLDSGKVIEGELRPSSDLPTHLELYRGFKEIGGVAHTHSLCATAWAQARRPIPPLGTTHADYFRGPVPCSRPLSDDEINGDYEANTGKVIVNTFARISPVEIPAVLVANHGPFSWGRTADDAVHNAAALEYLARLAATAISIEANLQTVSSALLDKHFFRKHGPGAYYGQKEKI